MAEAVEEDRFPGSETFVLKAALVLFMIGLFTGMWLVKKFMTWKNPNPKNHQRRGRPEHRRMEELGLLPNEIHIAPHTGEKHHIRKTCNGLNSAAAKRTLEPCSFCCV